MHPADSLLFPPGYSSENAYSLIGIPPFLSLNSGLVQIDRSPATTGCRQSSLILWARINLNSAPITVGSRLNKQNLDSLTFFSSAVFTARQESIAVLLQRPCSSTRIAQTRLSMCDQIFSAYGGDTWKGGESNPKADRDLWFAMGSQPLPAGERGPGDHRYSRLKSRRHIGGSSGALGKAVLSDLVVEFCASAGRRLADSGQSE